MILLYLLVPAAYLAAALLEWGRLAPAHQGTSERSALSVRRVSSVTSQSTFST